MNIYGGRFQPPHRGHLHVLKYAENYLGEVHIAMSRTYSPKSPFTFEQRQFLWNAMGVNKVAESVKPAFAPTEILSLDEPYVAIVGQKDKDRYENSKFFTPYHDGPLQPYGEGIAYYFVVPVMENGISATTIRDHFDDAEYLTKMYGDIVSDSEIFLNTLKQWSTIHV